jgi:hypothetical protein
MDELENLANRAESFERDQAGAQKWEPVSESEAKTKAGVVPPVNTIDAAENRAEGFLRVAEGVAKLIFDSRLMLDEEEIQSGRSSLSPAIQKYNMAGDGSGNLPFQEEISAGFYLGGLFKRFRRALAALKAKDKAEAEAKRQANEKANSSGNGYGEERKHETRKQSQSVPGDVGVWQEPDADAPKWLSL